MVKNIIENDSLFCNLLMEQIERYDAKNISEHFHQAVAKHSEYAYVYGLTVDYVRKRTKAEVAAQTSFKQCAGIEVVKALYRKRKYYTSDASVTHVFRCLIEEAKNKYYMEKQTEFPSSRFFAGMVRKVINECFVEFCKKYNSVVLSTIGEIK